eukprot:SAG31_NODE_33068_length_348_cov_0.831325_1_plen_95_part_10
MTPPSSRRQWLCCLLVAAHQMLLRTAAGVPVALDIGSTLQLVADDLLIASSANLTRTMHSPQPSFRTAIRPDAPWEADYAIGVVGTSVVADGGTI